MPLLNYQKRFAALVESGVKRQTIRAKRKHPAKPGQTLYHYTGLRTKACRKLREDVCTEVQDLILFRNALALDNILYDGGFDKFARNDGFKNWDEMRDWFEKTHGFPFEGDLIKW